MHRSATIRAGSLAALAFALVAGCSSAGNTSGQSGAKTGLSATIPVTMIADITGPLAFYGGQLSAGAKAAVDQVNSSGLLGASKIDLTIKDNTSSPATTTTLFNAAAKSDAVAVLGPSISSEALATTPLAQSAKMPYLVDTSPDGILNAGDYIYSVSTPQTAQVKDYAPLLAKRAKSVALIYANDNPTDVSIDKAMPDQLRAMGVRVTNNLGVALQSTDFSAVATKAGEGAPDAIGLLSGGTEVPSLVKALRTGGYQGLLWGTGGADGTVDAAGPQADGFQYQGEWAPNVPGDESTKFANVFAKVNPAVTAHYPAIDGYNEVLFLANALAKANSTDHATVLKGLQTVAATGFAGPGGKVTFTGSGNRQLISPTIFVEFRGGKAMAIEGTS